MSCSTTTTVWSTATWVNLAGALTLSTTHARHRLVEQQQSRLLDDQHADLEPLALAM